MGCCTSSANNNVEMLESAHSAHSAQKQEKQDIDSTGPPITSVPSMPSTDIGGIETQTPEQKNEIDKPNKPVSAETNILKDEKSENEQNNNENNNENENENETENANENIEENENENKQEDENENKNKNINNNSYKKKTTIVITGPRCPPICSIPEDKDIDPNDMNTPQITPDSCFSPNTPYSQIDDRLDLNASEDRLQFQIRMELQETEEKFEKDKKIHLRNQTFDLQVKTMQMREFNTLYQVYEKYATNEAKTKMNMQSLCDALEVFGIVIDGNRDLKKFVFNAFDSDNNKRWIDYNDFSSQLSAIVSSKDINALELLFQIFDIDQDGYLEYEDMARLLLAVNQIAVVATGEQENCTVIYTKKQCLKQAKRMISKHNLNGNKISFDQFVKMMKTKTEKDMMFDHMEQPSISFVIDAPRVSVL